MGRAVQVAVTIEVCGRRCSFVGAAHISPGDVVDSELALSVEHRGTPVRGEVGDGPHSYPGRLPRQDLVGLPSDNKQIYIYIKRTTESE